MYDFLFKHFGKKKADILIIGWYLFLLFLIYYLQDRPSGQFRYLEW